VLELRLLGPVQAVRTGRDVALGGPRQRAVLALLVLDAGRVVPADRLVEDIWRGRPPPGGEDVAVVCAAVAVGAGAGGGGGAARG
jgi:DNA-binding SARP family transcriptional activator